MRHLVHRIGTALKTSRPLRWYITAVPVIWAITAQGRQFSWGEFWLWATVLFPFNLYAYVTRSWFVVTDEKQKETLRWMLEWSVVLLVACTALISNTWDWTDRLIWVGFLIIWGLRGQKIMRPLLSISDRLLPVLIGLLTWFSSRESIANISDFWTATGLATIWFFGSMFIEKAFAAQEPEARSRQIRLAWLLFLVALVWSVAVSMTFFTVIMGAYVLLCYAIARAKQTVLPNLKKAASFGVYAVWVITSVSIVVTQPSWTWWYYGGYFIGTAVLVGISFFWGYWPEIHYKYVAKPTQV